jgi:hypothetical protein
MAQASCWKCQGEMQSGYVLDQTYGGFVLPTWREGVPGNSLFGQLKPLGPPFPVTIYRCTRCGFLESYADEPS